MGQGSSHQKRQDDADVAGNDSDPSLVPQLFEIHAHTDEKDENGKSDLAQGVQKAKRGRRKEGGVALDPDTGKLKWHYQEIPQDVWDYDAAYEIQLVDLTVGGRPRKALVHVTKSGFTWVLDRQTGEFLTAWPYVKNYNWITGISPDGKLVGRNEPEAGKTKLLCPSTIGGKSWNQSAYSPRTGWVYIPVLEICSDLIVRDEDPQEGRGFTGGSWIMKPPPRANQESVPSPPDRSFSNLAVPGVTNRPRVSTQPANWKPLPCI